MNTLILKLILAPLIIGGASLAGRRWGPAVSGWLIGLPITSGPIIFFLALSHDGAFVTTAALGTLSGGLSLVVYCLSYSWLAVYFKWPVAFAGGILSFVAVTTLMQKLVLPLVPTFVLVVLAILAGIWLMPKKTVIAANETKPGRWDLPARVLIGTSFILGLTGIAPFIGPRLTGLLSILPLYITILAIFAHRQQGGAAAISVFRGLLFGLFSFAGFFLVLVSLLEPGGIVVAFIAAILTTFVIQGLSLLRMRKLPQPTNEKDN
jgi:hypothetical protein